MIDHFTDMVAGSLGLKDPWQVTGARFDQELGQVHIYVGVRDGAALPCPRCGGPTVRYGYEPEERVWRHGDCMFYPTLVHCRRPRVRCDDCGVQQVGAPFERKSSRFTLLFEGYAMMLMADMPRAKVAAALRCDEKSLSGILSYWVGRAVSARSLEGVTAVAVDETSFKRGHSYVTLAIDAVGRRVIDVEEGRDKAAVERFAGKLAGKGGDPLKVEAVTSDMSKSYGPAIAEQFPNAEHVIDKFHVKQLVTSAMDEVRKAEQRAVADKKELFRSRWLFWVPRRKLTAEQSADLAALSRRFPRTGRACRIVAGLDDFYDSRGVEEAEGAFKALCSWMRRCRLGPMKEAALALMRHKEKILAYFKNRLTNAVCEGINSLVQAAKRKARGYRTFAGFAAMIYLVAGKLELQSPNPFACHPLRLE